jgi:hypothetical protein
MLQALRDPLRVFSDFVVRPATYIVFVDGGRYYVVNGRTGQFEYASESASKAIQYAVDKTSEMGGGRVFIRAGSYYLPYRDYVYLKDGVVVEGEGLATRLLMESANIRIISVRDVAVRNLYIAPYGLAESAKDTGSPPDAGAGIEVNGTDDNPAERILIENVVIEGERAILWVGPWSKATATPVVKDIVVRGCRLTKKGDSNYPLGNMVFNYVERGWIDSNYFRSRDWTAVPLDPGKPWSVAMAYTRFVWFTNNIIDGSHHNNITGGHNSFTFYVGNVFRYSDDAIDTDNCDHQYVIGNYVEENASLASFEGTVSDIIVAYNTAHNITELVTLGRASRVVIKGNISDSGELIYNVDLIEDIIIEGNMLRVTLYLFRFAKPFRRLRMFNNIIELAGDTRIWLGDDSGVSEDIEIAYNEFIGPSPGDDISFFVGRYDSATATKYYWARHVRIHHNTFRRCKYVYIQGFIDSAVYAWENVNLGYLDGGSNQIRFQLLDARTHFYPAQGNVRMTVSFDASIAGAQTRSVSNFLSLIPRVGVEGYVALCSIRSAPSGWAGYVMCRVNASNPESTVDVTLVTTSTATGTVVVDVVLMEAEPQGYGYTQPGAPRWRR